MDKQILWYVLGKHKDRLLDTLLFLAVGLLILAFMLDSLAIAVLSVLCGVPTVVDWLRDRQIFKTKRIFIGGTRHIKKHK
jgi:hypothetical protein